MTEIAAGRNALKIVGLLDSAKLGVRPERCLMVRHKNAGCLRCADVCTTGAITRGSDGRMAVDPDKCIGCGTCATACPSGCLEAKNPSDEELEHALFAALARGKGAAAIACEAALSFARGLAGDSTDSALLLADGAPVVGVVCLGRAEESMLVEAAARGARRITLVHHECGTCAHAPGGRLCETVCASARALLEAFGSSCAVERAAAGDIAWKPSPDAAASAVFAEVPADATEEARAAAAAETAAFTHVQADGTLPHFVPPRRLRLFNSLKRLAAANKPASDTFATRLWGQVTINTELCRSCRMCTVFCPTGAVARFDGANGAFGVEHRSALCMQCRLCETICPEQAITVSDAVSLSEFLRGTKFRFEMLPVGWRPNDSDAVATRVVRFMNTDRVQDPEARITEREMTEAQEYANKRDARRAEIRAEQGE
ncbi:MAG: 4Fe-4S binding protein [Eggerthellaceae bacterium]|nr:4Fe-4S binding protein [Eggerthellaceae bacterium]